MDVLSKDYSKRMEKIYDLQRKLEEAQKTREYLQYNIDKTIQIRQDLEKRFNLPPLKRRR